MKPLGQYITKWLAIVTLLVTVVIVVGWVFNLSYLKQTMPGIVNMKFNTALGFAAIGFALLLSEIDTPLSRRVSTYFLWFVVLIGAINVMQTLFGWQLGIDELLMKDDTVPKGSPFAGRPSVHASLGFVAVGVVLLLIRNKKMAPILLGILLAVLGSFTLVFLTQLFDNSFLRSINWLAQTAMLTAVMFIVVATAIIYSKHLAIYKLAFQQQIGLFFAISLFMLLFIFLAIEDNARQKADSEKRILYTYNVQLITEKIRSGSSDMLSAVRGYVITKEEPFLNFFDSAVTQIQTQLQQFKLLSNDNELQQAKADSLQRLTDLYIGTRRTLLAGYRNGNVDEKALVAGILQGQAMANELQQLLVAIQKNEQQQLERRENRNERTIANSNRIITIFQILVFVLIVFSFLVIYRNANERNKAEQKLKASETELRKSIANLNFALESAGIGSWTIDMLTGDIFRSGIHDSIFGYTEAPANWSFEIFLQKHLHPDDRQTVEEHWQNTKINGENLSFNCRIIKADGDTAWIWCKSKVFYNEANQPILLMGFVGDETAAKQAEQEIRTLNATLEKRVEEKTKEVLEKEMQFRDRLENMQEGIQIISPNWEYLFVNKAVVKQSKKTMEELLHRSMLDVYPGIQYSPLFKTLQECMQQRVSQSIVNEFEFPDGSKGWFELSVQPVPEGVLILSIDITDQKLLEKELLDRQLHQQKLITEVSFQTQEKERNELAKELHDNINQILATAKIYLSRAQKHEVIPQHLVQQGYECVNLAVEEIRKLSHSLVTPTLGETGLLEALQTLSRQFEMANGPEVAIINHLQPDVPIDLQKELMIYRVAQEQISNIIKHAKATKVIIELHSTPDSVSMTITDNGVGFDTAQQPKGIGLRNISSRVQFYSGHMHIASAPSHGCRLEIAVPL